MHETTGLRHGTGHFASGDALPLNTRLGAPPRERLRASCRSAANMRRPLQSSAHDAGSGTADEPRCSANSMPVTKPMPDIVVRGSFCPGIARRVSAKFRCVWRRNIHPHRVIRTIVGKRHGTTAGSGGKNREHVGGARDVHHPDDAANGGERQPKRVVARVVRDARDARKKDGIEGKQLRIRPIPIETVAACVPS